MLEQCRFYSRDSHQPPLLRHNIHMCTNRCCFDGRCIRFSYSYSRAHFMYIIIFRTHSICNTKNGMVSDWSSCRATSQNSTSNTTLAHSTIHRQNTLSRLMFLYTLIHEMYLCTMPRKNSIEMKQLYYV